MQISCELQTLCELHLLHLVFCKYRRLNKTLKEARVGQVVLSGILPIMGGRGEEYRNCRRMAINTQVQKVCMEE